MLRSRFCSSSLTLSCQTPSASETLLQERTPQEYSRNPSFETPRGVVEILPTNTLITQKNGSFLAFFLSRSSSSRLTRATLPIATRPPSAPPPPAALGLTASGRSPLPLRARPTAGPHPYSPPSLCPWAGCAPLLLRAHTHGWPAPLLSPSELAPMARPQSSSPSSSRPWPSCALPLPLRAHPMAGPRPSSPPSSRQWPGCAPPFPLQAYAELTPMHPSSSPSSPRRAHTHGRATLLFPSVLFPKGIGHPRQNLPNQS